MKSKRPALHTLAGLYATHSLTPPDRARFERHMGKCPECAARVSEFANVAAHLAAAISVPPPPGLKQRVLEAAAQGQQRSSASKKPGVPQAIRAARATRAPRRRARLTAALAATCLIIIAIFGLTARDAQHRLTQELQGSRQIAAILTARDAIMLDSPVTTGGAATVVMSGKERALVFAAAGLRVLPSSECYELWLIGPSGDQPAGMLPSPANGRTGPVVTSGLAAGDRLGLSIEPAGGSDHPTSSMLLELAL